MTRNLRLHQILRVSAGESVSLLIMERDSVCGDQSGLDEWHCRRVRVVSPVEGQLTVEVPASSAEPSFFIKLVGSSHLDFRSSFRIAAAAGSETILDVLLVGARAGTTTLTTRVEPS